MKQQDRGLAVVTGAARGIGQALAFRFAKEGFSLAILDVDLPAAEATAGAIRATGRLAHAIACDVSDRAQVRAAAGGLRSLGCAVRMIWANAGVGQRGGIAFRSKQAFEWMFAVNVHGTLNTLEVLLPLLLDADGDRHVGVTASVAGLVASNTITPASSATKAAVIGIGEALRAELASEKIGVTIACPGLVNTEIWNGARIRPPHFGGPHELPAAAGERHRIQGLSANWTADRIWERVVGGGGYVVPVTGPDIQAGFDARWSEIREGFRFPD